MCAAATDLRKKQNKTVVYFSCSMIFVSESKRGDSHVVSQIIKLLLDFAAVLKCVKLSSPHSSWMSFQHHILNWTMFVRIWEQRTLDASCLADSEFRHIWGPGCSFSMRTPNAPPYVSQICSPVQAAVGSLFVFLLQTISSWVFNSSFLSSPTLLSFTQSCSARYWKLETSAGRFVISCRGDVRWGV